MTTIADRKVLVTGANRGLGREFVQQFLARGAGTVYAAARDPQSVEVTDVRVVPVALDIVDPDSVAAAAAAHPDVDIVVNNAGIALIAPVVSTDVSALRRELEVNLFGSLAVTAAFADSVRRSRGAIVNVASVLSWIGVGASYSVSKAALWSATDSMRLEFAPAGVQVLGVHMGYVDTDMAANVTAPKSTPAQIVTAALDALEAGEAEVLADDTARAVKAGLSLPAEQRYAAFTAAS
ncbi:SDR family oxidoreductase [Jatrophihabitans sp. YIM 134969]